MIACSNDNGVDNSQPTPEAPVPNKITLSQQVIEVGFDPDSYSIDVTSPCSWEAFGKSDWIEIETKQGDAGVAELFFNITTRNEELEKRMGSIIVTNSDYNLVAELYIIQESIEDTIICYTSIDDNVVTPYNLSAFGANIISNTYNNGIGVIAFDGKVTTIGDDAFSGCFSLTCITIPDSVTSIGDWAFCSCESLTDITIPSSVTKIGNRAFNYCHSLTEFNGKLASEDGRCLIIDGTLNAFAPAGLTEYTIPDSVTSIGNYAFSDCSSLTEITIPDSVTTIGLCAFSGCSSLTAFNGKFASKDGRCLIIDGTLNTFAPAGLTEYIISNSVTTIGEGAFYRCISLTSVTIPDSVTTIGEWAFYGCFSLTCITIPDNVTTIGMGAFNWCSSLTSVTIGESVTTIGEGAFSGCFSLTCITIPDNVTTIGEGAFYNCSSLTSVTIPDSVTEIGDYTFYWCSSLTSVAIGESVTTIGEGAFYGCSSLTSVTIPDSVTTIGNYAFEYCSSLTSVYCKATTPPAGGGDMFSYNASGRKIYVPMESVEAYKSASGWSYYKYDIVGYNF